MSIDFNSLKEECNQLMMAGKPNKAGKLLGETLKFLDQSTYDPFCQILRSVLEVDTEGFMEKGYPWLIAKGRKLSPEKWMEMEMVFLNKYSLLPGEQIAAVFHGGMTDKWAIYGGRVYLTNFRLILNGVKMLRGGYARGLAAVIILSVVQSIRQSVTRAIQKTLAAQGGANVVTLGYIFPTYGCYNIKRGNKDISYKIDVTYEKKNEKVKTETMEVSISPSRLKTQDKKQFNEETLPAILDHVNAMLNQMAGMKV